MDNKTETVRMKWYFRPVAILIAILAVGPFAIPLVWLSPAFKKWHKIAITIAVILLTIWLARASVSIVQAFQREMQALQETMK